MPGLPVFLFALAFAVQEPTSGIVITADEIAATLKASMANSVIDTMIKGVEIKGYHVTVAMLHRQKAETSALLHDRVTEIYQILEGSGTLVTGGTIAGAKPNDLTRLGAGPGQSGTHQEGESRKVGPKDVIILPAGLPHRFSQLDGPISYLVYRVDPGR